MIPATKFASNLAGTFNRLGLTVEQINSLVAFYGIGDKAPDGSRRARLTPYLSCGWMDLCEDVDNAVDMYAGKELPADAASIYPRGIKY